MIFSCDMLAKKKEDNWIAVVLANLYLPAFSDQVAIWFNDVLE